MATQAESSNTRIKNDAPEPSKGTSVLPVARVAKIVKSDKDIAMCSKEALFLMSVATEEFLKKLTLASYTEALSNKRKGVQYKDLSTAIQQDDAYFYLQEVIPPPIPVEKAVKARKKKLAEAAGDVAPPDAADAPPAETVDAPKVTAEVSNGTTDAEIESAAPPKTFDADTEMNQA